MKSHFLTAFICILFFSPKCYSQDGKFTFSISKSTNTSAGVFKDDSILVKTLWSNVSFNSGTYTKSWDGKDDYGADIASSSSNFKVKILSSNVNYQWQGILGNTSKSQTGSGVHRGYYHCMRGLVFTNGYGYFCKGYSEGAPSLAKFLISDPQTKIDFINSKQTGDINYVATDDVNVYWGAFDANANSNSFVFATKVGDDSDVNFTKGSSYTITYGRTYKSISTVNQFNSYITGLAVQKHGNYLFVARAGLNQLQVLNKTTGELVKTLSFSTPKSLCVDKSDNLWMVTGMNTVIKYTVNADGSLSAGSFSLPGLVKPAAIQVSTDGNFVSVADDSTSQQVKFYNNTSGAPTSTLGTAGGYFIDPVVNNNKFYFNDLRTNKLTFIAYEPDGSFWVGEPGNYRAQHYAANQTYINNIQSLGANYQTGVDKNNLSKVFSGNLEFSIDYSVQNLSGSAGWKLHKNWGANIPAYMYQDDTRFQTTLSNGRTYGIIRSVNNSEVVEFPANGPMRFTGVRLVELSKILCEDGSLQDCSVSGSSFYYKRYPLLGFDGLNNPIWSPVPEILATGIKSATGNPVAFPLSPVLTSSNKVVFFNYNAYSDNAGPVFSKGYHLGAMSRGGNSWLFQTEKSTHRNYNGDFPSAGYFDVGNLVNDYAGGNVNVMDRNIITSYHGEFWKNGQTNMYNHYWDNGLAIGQFGTTRERTTGESAAMMAGNALTPTIAKDANGDYYLYHGDESDHAGVHRWKITGLNTISEQVVDLAAPATYQAPVDYVDLMKGLPFDADLPNNTAGWTRNPAVSSVVDVYSNAWSALTGKLKYDQLTSPDILINFVNTNSTSNIVARDLGYTYVSNSWKISGDIAYPGNMPNANNISQYFEVLDNNGRVLTRFYPSLDRAVTPFVGSLFFNKSVITTSSEMGIKNLMNNYAPFEIKMINGVVTFTYGNYSPVTTTIFDPAGDWKSPKTLRCIFTASGNKSFQVYSTNIGLKDCKFYKDFLPLSGVNQLPLVNAGNDQAITLPANSATFTPTASDPDGVITGYAWTKIAGPAGGNITSVNSAATSITGLDLGIYRYQLKVTDNTNAFVFDTVQIAVIRNNQMPVVNAGADLFITIPAISIGLNASASDADGSIVSYKWSKISGPISFILSSPAESSTNVTGLFPGVYEFEIEATDDKGAVVKDIVKVTVSLSSVNLPPIANGSTDKTLVLPTNSTTLYGTASDPDGLVKTCLWTKISGPDAYVIATPGAPTTIIYNMAVGVYLFEMAITDNMYAVNRDTVKVTVNPGAVNYLPVLKVGGSKALVMPWNNTSVQGSATDIDGTIANYKWKKVSGPPSYYIHSPDSPNTDLGMLLPGTYVFELKVTDNSGAAVAGNVTINVDPFNYGFQFANQPPVANAGVDQTTSLPANNISLTGSGLDPDGIVSSYVWTQVSGPSTGVILSPNSATTKIASLVQGVYQFELITTDNFGATAKDQVQVIVNGSANIIVNLLPAVNPSNTVNGLDYKYYEGNWNVLPAFSALNPVKTGTADNFTLSLANRADQYGFSFTGYINVPADGQYTFYTTSDDGSSLYIDNVLTVSNDGLHDATERSGTIGLKAGKHAINGLFFEQTFGQVFTVSYEGVGISKQVIPATALYRVSANAASVANAGTDQTITLPTNSVSLTGSGTDSDGSIGSYSWAKISGPATGSIVTANEASTLLNNLTEGVYQFELTVTDNAGGITKDQVQVTVNAAPGVNLLAAVNPSNTVNGLDYEYYEGSWNVLPAFELLTPVKTGTTDNFTLSLANRAEQYGFSFTGFINVPLDGKYTFYTTSDDGSSLYIDNVLTVSNDGVHDVIERSGTIGLKAGKHAITCFFFQQFGGQVFNVSYEGMGISKKAIPSDALYRNAAPATVLLAAVNPSNTVNGLDYKYYEGSWNVLPAFGSLTPVKTGTTDNFTLSLANRAEQYGFSFTGFINVPSDGQYIFYTTSDDGSNLYIDNVLTVANDGLHSATERSGTIGLKAGKHAITGLFFEQTVSEVFEVSYEGMGISKQAIPTSALYRINEVPTGKVAASKGTVPLTLNLFEKDNTLTVYPNPTKDIAYLGISAKSKNNRLTITVYNSVGMQVRFYQPPITQGKTQLKLDLTGLSNGVYAIIGRFDDGEVINCKLMKSR